MFEVQFVKRHPDARIPSYAHEGDAGADLFSCEEVILLPYMHLLVDTGIAVAMPKNWVGLVHPRSGLASRLGVTVLNAPGTVDSGYRGKIMVNLINHGSAPYHVRVGDRIAQIVFQKFEKVNFVEVQELDPTSRGEAGYGSTGGFKDGKI